MVISVLTQEYEGVASSDVIFKDFYQLRQEQSEKVQIFSIQLRDMLTRLSLRFPGRVPREDHDKILKDHFFYGIRSDLQNSIRHLYNDDMVTFSQLLVKVRRNEEEEMTSKLVNKGAVMDDALEERVDRLIAKYNQRQPLNTSFWGNPDNSHNYGRSPSNESKGEREILPPTPKNHGLIFGKI